ncbi:hypothetical protein [Paraburkholderia solisilvae]|uniref:Uncharacterized protein n=1 Tax=Paraburkholderia solisilvae TaxID=624376 RepID=A0A6J5DNQ0_9BURK|nr:hypothetical protein [Paraburkholderia solisilvae]CAB3755553.1 hypothetical protein LMG29739_02200 [Paraburkholderia solisilvae]
MSSRHIAEQRSAQALPAGALAAHISTLKPAGGDNRAELIRDVVDGLMRLRNSVLRFVLLFVSHDNTALRDAQGEEYRAAPLLRLLTLLGNAAQAAQFDRMRELRRTIRDARALEKTRDAVFSESFSNDPAALRAAAAELERVDAILVGLCVEHVLERQLATPIDAVRVGTVLRAERAVVAGGVRAARPAAAKVAEAVPSAGR